MNKQKVVISLLTLGIVGALSYTFVGSAFAQTESSRDTLIQRLVSRFNLNQSEVDSVVQEFHNERQAEMKANIEARLEVEVQNGNITAEQKNKIIAKLNELRDERQAGDKPTLEERTVRHEELESWAEENGIDLKYVLGFGRGRGMGGEGKMRGFNQE